MKTKYIALCLWSLSFCNASWTRACLPLRVYMAVIFSQDVRVDNDTIEGHILVSFFMKWP